MTTPTSRPRLAVLIDAENTSADHAAFVMDQAAALGQPTVRRAYGEWMTPQLGKWKRVVNRLGIQPRQCFRYLRGRNTADIALVIDAVDLIHERCVDGFCLVSSDSDFIGLAARIRQAGMLVYGFGKQETMRDFVVACDGFVFVDQTSS